MILTRVDGIPWSECVSCCAGCSIPLITQVSRERQLEALWCGDCLAAGLDQAEANKRNAARVAARRGR
jgi:hypothetical protein